MASQEIVSFFGPVNRPTQATRGEGAVAGFAIILHSHPAIWKTSLLEKSVASFTSGGRVSLCGLVHLRILTKSANCGGGAHCSAARTTSSSSAWAYPTRWTGQRGAWRGGLRLNCNNTRDDT